ncbi:unnamed protein product [Mytilus edulis]|uniref:Uncharacterized protein n=1 Tax=Mytilus edulis TaxID=6550 RepID=A0A8S3TXG0_MYTED|nr:unnamed protein product [Mytilus edulis]
MAISPDDLNIYSEIAKTVLGQIDLLQNEVQMIMSEMVARASIDTKQSAEVVVSLTVPDTTADAIQFEKLKCVTYISSKEIVKEWNKRGHIHVSQSSIPRHTPDLNSGFVLEGYSEKESEDEAKTKRVVQLFMITRQKPKLNLLVKSNTSLMGNKIADDNVTNTKFDGEVKEKVEIIGEIIGMSYQDDLMYVVIEKEEGRGNKSFR